MSELNEHITTTIECDECSEVAESPVGCSQSQAIADFKDDGWITRDGAALCPACAVGEEE